METQIITEQLQDTSLYVLHKHTYPLWLRMFILLVCSSFIYRNFYFILYELSYHQEMKQKINAVDNYFKSKNYLKTISLLSEILKKHPQYKEGRLKIIKLYFNLIDSNNFDQKTNDYLFSKGIDFMKNYEFTKNEKNELENILPENYKEAFDDLS